MSRFFRYFCLQLKRFFKLAPVVLALSALLLGALGAAFYGLFSAGESGEENSLINIGIVGDMEDSYLGMAINALQNLDSSRFSIAVETTDDEKTAADQLKRGELVAYVVIPDNFLGEAIHGNVQKITCVISAGASDFGAQITNELMDTITEIVANSQRTVYGFHSAAFASGMDSGNVYKKGNEVALETVTVILNRESAYQITEIGTSGYDAIDDPLLCGMIVLLLMLWGITCCTIFTSRSGALRRVLSAKGTGAVSQVLGEYLAYLVFMTVTLGILAAAVALFAPLLPSVSLLEDYDFTRLLPGIFLPVLTLSSMHFFLYEVTNSTVSSALLQFLCAMGAGYISGCVYPAFFFPREVQNAAALFPAWHCRLLLDELLADAISVKTLAILGGYFAVFLILSVLLRRARIKREGGGA